MGKKARVNTGRNDTVLPMGPGRKPNKANRKKVCFVCILIALSVGLGMVLLARLREYEQARQEYEVYARMTEAPRPTAAPETVESAAAVMETAMKGQAVPTPTATAKRFYSAKVSALRRDNPDTVGFLEIPGTTISYPLVQTDNNEYYVEHTFAKKRNASGAIFMDCWNAKDFSDFNTVIYGHNMNDGSMFAGLREYEHPSFATEHSTIEITQFDAKRTYQVFAAYVSQGEEEADFRGQSCALERDRAAFLYEAKKRSLIQTDLAVSSEDRLVTLVTCTSGRHPWYFVVHGVLTEEQLEQEMTQ